MSSNISIYVPAYNAEKTIKMCINSILTQTIQPEVILVVNDGSTDNTSKILQDFGNKIITIDNKKNMGVSHSMNIATSYLKTRYIGKIDADVELMPDWTETLLKTMNEQKATLIGCKMYEKYLDNPFNLWRSIRLKQNWGEENISNPKFIFGCNNILDSSKLDNEKKYRDDLEYFKTNGEDIEFSNYLKKKNLHIFYCSDTTCHHLQDDDAQSLAHRYWRYIHYGDGLKKRNLFKTIKNIFRQFKRILKWSLSDILQKRIKLIKVNFLLFYYFSILDYKFYVKNKDEN